MEDRIQQSKLINRALIIISVLLVFTLLYFIGRNALILYQHPTYKFSIKYPGSWMKVENTEGAAVAFISPKDSSVDSFQENVSVVVQDLTNNVMSLQKYTDMAIFQMKVTLKSAIQVLEGESGPIYLGGKPGYKFVYLVRGDPEIKIMHAWTIEGNKAYQINIAVPSSQFNDFKGKAEQIIDSFRIP